jgi:hypothetical protein
MALLHQMLLDVLLVPNSSAMQEIEDQEHCALRNTSTEEPEVFSLPDRRVGLGEEVAKNWEPPKEVAVIDLIPRNPESRHSTTRDSEPSW